MNFMPNDIVVCVDVTPRWAFIEKDDPLNLIELDSIYTISEIDTDGEPEVVRLAEVNSGSWFYIADRFRLVYRIPDVSSMTAWVPVPEQI